MVSIFNWVTSYMLHLLTVCWCIHIRFVCCCLSPERVCVSSVTHLSAVLCNHSSWPQFLSFFRVSKIPQVFFLSYRKIFAFLLPYSLTVLCKVVLSSLISSAYQRSLIYSIPSQNLSSPTLSPPLHPSFSSTHSFAHKSSPGLLPSPMLVSGPRFVTFSGRNLVRYPPDSIIGLMAWTKLIMSRVFILRPPSEVLRSLELCCEALNYVIIFLFSLGSGMCSVGVLGVGVAEGYCVVLRRFMRWVLRGLRVNFLWVTEHCEASVRCESVGKLWSRGVLWRHRVEFFFHSYFIVSYALNYGICEFFGGRRGAGMCRKASMFMCYKCCEVLRRTLRQCWESGVVWSLHKRRCGDLNWYEPFTEWSRGKVTSRW